MSRWKVSMLLSGWVALMVPAFAGCAGENGDQTPAPPEAQTGGVTIPEEMSGIAKLPQEEQQAALDQQICLVSEKPLGSMGKPIKVDAGGQQVFVCCDGCVDMVKQDPEKYLAKLNEQ